MTRKIAMLVCTMLFALSMAIQALAAEQFYPSSVEEYMVGDALRIKKIYKLSPEDDPSAIVTGDFERDGSLYYLLDIIRSDEMGVDVQTHTETVTLDSDTGVLSEVLKRLDAEMEFTSEDGYTGVLSLEHNSVTVEAKGYKTSTRSLSATRTYSSLSDADLSLIPKTVEDSGKTLELADVQWSEDEGGETYTATASYSGTASSSYATGYTVTASYTGEITKTDCEAIIYTAIFGSLELPQEEDEEPEPEPESEEVKENIWDHFTGVRDKMTLFLVIAALCACLLILIPICLKSKRRKGRHSMKGKRRNE